ncbi:NAD(P)H-dependent flavin oxidoreductase [Microbacterium sp. A93]|uniref:NAD(P)H-dependent flavin oxidoreductase n=1 Tax=Microbacterium sp. A93 TaxID=3450716 RepID=UPI003F42597D
MFDNAVSRALGVAVPVVQAPMGWVARSELASAVRAAGAFGVIETSSGEIVSIIEAIRRMGELGTGPFGVNLALNVIAETTVVEEVIASGVKFVTTSAGSPTRFTETLKAAGITVYHVVPSLEGALKAVDAGVDGLIVEGGEGGGVKSPDRVSTMVLLPLVRSRVDVPIIAAGGIVDGVSMAAAFALGAEGVQMGTRLLASAESPVHPNWKHAIVAAKETDTIILNGGRSPALRVLRTAHTEELLGATHNVMGDFTDRASLMEQYFGGRMDVSIPFSGQVVGRIDSIDTVGAIISQTIHEFTHTISRLAR